jgi:hypothetical protein
MWLDSQWRRIAVLGAVAMALHALALTYRGLLENRRGSARSLHSQDNTAELLQFASQSEWPSRRASLALPPNPVLPPPSRASVPSSLHRKGRSNNVLPQQAASRSSRGSAVSAGSRVQPLRGGDSASPKGERPRGSWKEVAGRVSSSHQASSRVEPAEDWNQALERLRGVVRPEPAQSGAAGNALFGGTADSATASEPYGRLWEQAHPQRFPLSRSSQGTGGVEIRLVPWPVVREAGVSIRHGQVVFFPEMVLMLWLQGEHLYLLQSPRRLNLPS